AAGTKSGSGKRTQEDKGDGNQSAGSGDGAGSVPPAAQAGANAPSAAAETEPQAVQGGLAETGAHLWPAAIGAVLVTAGFVLLRRMGRRSV
ncbi:hypothetical protein IPZ69_10280, partial [Streptomyces olivochromogenes]|nr:hypothetical protein [Streptomyces olivochromogenes]